MGRLARMKYKDVPRKDLVELLNWCEDQNVMLGQSVRPGNVYDPETEWSFDSQFVVMTNGCSCYGEPIEVPESLRWAFV